MANGGRQIASKTNSEHLEVHFEHFRGFLSLFSFSYHTKLNTLPNADQQIFPLYDLFFFIGITSAAKISIRFVYNFFILLLPLKIVLMLKNSFIHIHFFSFILTVSSMDKR